LGALPEHVKAVIKNCILKIKQILSWFYPGTGCRVALSLYGKAALSLYGKAALSLYGKAALSHGDGMASRNIKTIGLLKKNKIHKNSFTCVICSGVRR